MEKIKELLETINFFKNTEYEILPIQKCNKNYKFLLTMQNKKYLLIFGEKNIQKYKIRFQKLGKYFEQLVGLQYMDEENNFLLLDYYGNGEGTVLSQCKLNQEENEFIADKLKKILDSIHYSPTQESFY